MSDDILTIEQIEALLLRVMPRLEWLELPAIYRLVESNATLTAADWEPDAPGSNGIRWRRNVRNMLQSRKSLVGDGGIFEWDPAGRRYRLP